MDRRLVTTAALVCALLPAFAGTASAAQAPWLTVAKRANVACLSYDNKIFKLPGLAAMQKVNSAKDLTPALLKTSGEKYWAGDLALEQTMVHTWSTLPMPKEARYRTAWARWLSLWRTVRIPAAEKIAASAKQGDVKGLLAAEASVTAHKAAGEKLAKTLAFGVCQWD